MRMNHRRAYVTSTAQKFLDRPDVIAIQEVRREKIVTGVWAGLEAEIFGFLRRNDEVLFRLMGSNCK